MKSAFLHLILLLLYTGCSAQANDKAYAELTKENLLNDIDCYKKEIVNKHINPFTKINRKHFFEAIEKIKKDAAAQNTEELLTALMKVNAELQDEHTRINFKEEKIFPCFFYWFQEGIIVVKTDTAYKKFLY